VKRIVPAVITMAVGWITLATYFWAPFLSVRIVLVEWAITAAAFGMLLGFVNVFSVHATRIIRQRPGWPYSLVLFASLAGVAAASFVDAGASLITKTATPTEGLAQQGIAGPVMTGVYQYVLIPLQATLAALLPFVLAFAAYRMFRVRPAGSRAGAVVFLVAAIIVLLGQMPLFNLPVFGGLREWVVRVMAMPGMRGILLGVALGVTATALRVLIGADRPTSD
jgi:hypothetical protein